MIVRRFLAALAKENDTLVRISPDAMDSLAAYRWPGNVRELQNICERAAVLTPGQAISGEMIAPWLSGRRVSPTSQIEPKRLPAAVEAETAAFQQDLICNGDLTLEVIEREVIMATLEKNNGHRQKSAAALGIGVRTLGLKLKKWKEMKIIPQTA